MHRFDEEIQKVLVGAVAELKAVVTEDPIVFPIPVVDGVLVNVSRGGLVSIILTGQLLQIVKAR